MPLWLIGMMGSGKSVVGRVLAAQSDRDFLDTDHLVEVSAGRSIGKIFAEEGERGFRLRESEAIAAAAVSSGDAVIATGGGAVLVPANVAAMKASGPVVWLQAHPSTLASRMADQSDRPLLNGRSDEDRSGGGDVEARVATILEARLQAYEAAADYRVPTDHATVQEVAALIEEIWNAS